MAQLLIFPIKPMSTVDNWWWQKVTDKTALEIWARKLLQWNTGVEGWQPIQS